MQITQLVQIKVTKGEHDFTFHIPVGTTWGTAVDATNDLLLEVCEQAKKALGATKPAEEAPLEPEVVEGSGDGQ
jgi:hypothetical protein